MSARGGRRAEARREEPSYRIAFGPELAVGAAAEELEHGIVAVRRGAFPPRVGAHVRLELVFEDAPVAEVAALVVWTRPGHAGAPAAFGAQLQGAPPDVTARLAALGRSRRAAAAQAPVAGPVCERVRALRRTTPAALPAVAPVPLAPVAIPHVTVLPFPAVPGAPSGSACGAAAPREDAPPACAAPAPCEPCAAASPGLEVPGWTDRPPASVASSISAPPWETGAPAEPPVDAPPASPWAERHAVPVVPVPAPPAPPAVPAGSGDLRLVDAPGELAVWYAPPGEAAVPCVWLSFTSREDYLLHYRRFLAHEQVYLPDVAAPGRGAHIEIVLAVPDGAPPMTVRAVVGPSVRPPVVARPGWLARMAEVPAEALERLSRAAAAAL